MTIKKDNNFFRGFLQSGDGVITDVVEADDKTIRFRTEFRLSDPLVERLRNDPGNIVFSERSRIARLGVIILCEGPTEKHLDNGRIVVTLSASQTIDGYPGIDMLKELFTNGLPVGRLVYCDPESLLSSGEVFKAVERSELKLPASTSISGDGSIVIVPHRTVCVLTKELTRETLQQILLRPDGREILNRYQVGENVSSVTVLPGKGVITTCSMYLNDHCVVLESGGKNGFVLGRHFPALVLDPIKTRGIRIYLEIFNNTRNPIVNPLITARVYRSRPAVQKSLPGFNNRHSHGYETMRKLENQMDTAGRSNCHYLSKPAASIPRKKTGPEIAEICQNGPEEPCRLSRTACMVERRRFTPQSRCAHASAISRIKKKKYENVFDVALKYFPNLVENRDVLNLVFEQKISALYFYEASSEHGPFLSQRDHNRLRDYNDLGLDVYWVSGLNNRLMVHTMRDGKGYFVVPERLADFHKAMLFAFYGSNRPLSPEGRDRLGKLMDNLISFWGKGIGIVTGGGSGVMELVNTFARERNILSGANFLDITDQTMTTDVDFCQTFQSSCRHSRQKWFEVASFPIFNVGGLGTLEELGITLCNMKLSIQEPVPLILFDTEGDGSYWKSVTEQIYEMIRQKRAPEWGRDNLVITDDPNAVVDTYRQKLQLF